MKFRSWMETHIVRPKKKNKKEKSGKKGSELSVSLPERPSLDSAGNSPTSPQLPKRQPVILPEVLEHTFDSPEVTSPARYFLHASHAQFLNDRTNHNNCFYSPFRGGNRGVCACACFNTGLSPLACTCYPMFDEQCNLVEEFRKLHSIRTTYLPLDQLQDTRNSNVSSPRQRSKIRTNPWLTPKSAKEYGKSFRTSSSSSECGSTSEDNFQEGSGSQSSARHSYMSMTTDGSNDTGGDVTPSDLSLTTPASSSKDTSCCGDSTFSSDERDKSASGGLTKQDKKKMGAASDSDSDECETLNELGQFEENYEYERETDILDDDTDDEAVYSGHRLFYGGNEDGLRTPTYAQNSSDSDTASEKIEYADMDEESSDSSTPLEAGINLAINIVGDEVTTDDNIAAETDTLALTDSDTPNASTSQLISPISEARSIEAVPSPKSLSVSSHSLSSHEERSSSQVGSRTLGEIRESLEEKVRRLRLERLFVEEKIREAREEERIRREEKIKFQKQLILHRRQILLRTLRNLREKLEDQSARLQDAYSATLEMQLQVRRQLGTNSVHPLLATTPIQEGGQAREAPF